MLKSSTTRDWRSRAHWSSRDSALDLGCVKLTLEALSACRGSRGCIISIDLKSN